MVGAEDINLLRMAVDVNVLRVHGGAWIDDVRPDCDGDAGWFSVRPARARRGRVVVGIAGLAGKAMRDCSTMEAVVLGDEMSGSVRWM